jgi:PKD repeat protein
MKTTTTQALHTAAFTGLLSLTLLTPAMAADFSGNLKGVTITDSQAANKPPVATFTYSINGETVTFNASGSSDPDGSIAEYKWDFGDGSTGEGGTVTHQFASSGTFPITLTLLDNANAVAVKQEKISTSGGGTVFYWSVDTLPTTTMVSDYGNITITKYSKDGTSSPGFKGNALKQTGTWQTYTIPMGHVPATKGTISMYVQHDSAASTTDSVNRYFFSSTKQGQANALYAYTYKGMIFFYLYDSSGGYRRIYGTVSWDTGKWYKYEFTWDASGYLGISRDGTVLLENTLESWQAKIPSWTDQQFFISSTYPMGSFDEISISK